MKRLVFSLLLLCLLQTQANANCQWGYLNELNKDIKHAQGLLSDYSTCRNNCNSLETGLKTSVAKMSKTNGCGAHIVTATNDETINFIAGRFRLIQKQKTGRTWTETVAAKPTITKPVMKKPAGVITPVVAVVKPVWMKPQRVVRNVEVVRPQKKAVVTRQVSRPLAPKRNVQQVLNQQHQAQHLAKQQQLKKQRLDNHLKQALIQEEKIRLVKNKRRLVQIRLNKQRLVRQQFLKKRALAIRVNQRRARQQRLARLNKIRLLNR